MLHAIFPMNAITSFCVHFAITAGLIYVFSRIMWSRRFRMSRDELAALKPSDMRHWPHWMLVIYTVGFGFALAASSTMGRVFEAAHLGTADEWIWYVLGAAIPVLAVMVPIELLVRWVSRKAGPMA